LLIAEVLARILQARAGSGSVVHSRSNGVKRVAMSTPRLWRVKLQDRLDAVANAKLLHDVRHVVLYGPLSAFEVSCYLFVGPALRDKCEDFLLARTSPDISH